MEKKKLFYIILGLALAVVFTCIAIPNEASANADKVYLSDMEDKITSSATLDNRIGFDVVYVDDRTELSVANRVFDKGLNIHCLPSENAYVEFDISGCNYTQFVTYVGLLDYCPGVSLGHGTVNFIVKADGQIVAESGEVKYGEEAKFLAADITVAAKTAKIGVPTINLGGIPCWTATQLLPRIVGHACAADILLTGRVLSAEECYRLHLVQYLTEKESLMDKAMEVANTLADKSPWAVSLMRKSIKKGIEMPLDDALELEREIFKECYTSSDRTEATAAFLEKRPHKPYNNRSYEIE